VAQIFRDFFRRERDVVARFGGEEFSVILPETSAEQAMQLLESLRVKVEKAVLHFEQFSIPVTMSAGVAVFDGYLPLTAPLLMRTVDSALYKAKKQGRNCVVQANVDETPERPFKAGMQPLTEDGAVVEADIAAAVGTGTQAAVAGPEA
jgi:diguanylate cyclase (GGDEF)-like protein